jgi:hypothetical protein
MPRTRAPYPPEFGEQMVELVRPGRTPEELDEEFEPSAQMIRNLAMHSERDRGTRNDACWDSPPAATMHGSAGASRRVRPPMRRFWRG